MRAIVLALLALFLLPALAAAQGQLVTALTLERGQGVVLRFDEGGGVMLMQEGVSAGLSPFAAAVAQDNARGVYDEAVGNQVATIPYGKYPEPPQLEPQVLRMGFVAVPGREDTILVIENGYDQALSYRVRITRPGRAAEPSDVCLATPGRHHFEHWPYTIDRIELFDMRVEPWRSGDPVPCA